VQEGRPAAAYRRRIDLLLFFLALFFDIIFYVIDLVVIVRGQRCGFWRWWSQRDTMEELGVDGG
jgi:hypothetical protein